MNLKTKSLVLLILLALVVTPGTWAADLSLTCSEGAGCSKSGSDPLFNSADGLWFPGRELIKTINIKNTGGSSHQLAVEVSNLSGDNTLAGVMHIKIQGHGGTVYFDSTLQSLLDHSSVNLTNLAGGADQDFDFIARMNEAAGNDYQNKTISFDLRIGFWDEEQGSNNSGGISVDNSVSGGGPTTTSALVPELAGSSTGGEVLGTATSSVPEAGAAGEIQPEGDILGTQTGICVACFWWPLLLAEAILLYFYFFLLKSSYMPRPNLLALVFPALIFALFLRINQGCTSDLIFCRYFWFLDLSVYLLFLTVKTAVRKPLKKKRR